MTEPKHEEQGECVAGQFIECHVHRHSGSVSNSLSVRVEIRFAGMPCAHHSWDQWDPALDV